MAFIRHWKASLQMGLCVIGLGLVGCGAGDGETSPTPSDGTETISGTTAAVRGVARLGGQQRLSEIMANQQPRRSFETPEPVVLRGIGTDSVPFELDSSELELERPGAGVEQGLDALGPELADLGQLRSHQVGPGGSAEPSPPPAVTFQATGTSGTPPDTMGAVGPNHVVTIINFRVVIQTRTGETLSELDLDSFFGSVIPPANDGFDPRAAYDPFSNRFILTCPSGVGFRGNSTNLLAVSQTSDPTGPWNFYSFPADPAGLRWADHNGLGFNSKWIVIHANMVPLDGSGADFRQHFWAFDKAALYAGASPAPFTLMTGDGWQSTPSVTYDPTEPDLYLLETQCGNCDGNGVLRVRRITGAIGSETLQDFATVTTAPWGGGLFVPQQGSSSTINFSLDWIQNVVVRHGSIWATHQVGLPASSPTHVAVRWLEIDPSPLTVIQQGTLEDPTGVNHYGYPSIAVNSNEDVLIGYSRSSSLQFVSANYAARAASDPPGTLREDRLYQAGEAPYDGSRWGDYTNTVIDPVDDLSMWTIQQVAAEPASFSYELWWAKVPPPGPTTGCSASTAIDLGPRTTQTTVASNACVKVSQYPSWWQFTNGLVTLQSGTGTFPVPATWTDACTSATGAFTFTTSWQSQPIGNHTTGCAAVIQLNGNGSPLQVTWW